MGMRERKDIVVFFFFCILNHAFLTKSWNKKLTRTWLRHYRSSLALLTISVWLYWLTHFLSKFACQTLPKDIWEQWFTEFLKCFDGGKAYKSVESNIFFHEFDSASGFSIIVKLFTNFVMYREKKKNVFLFLIVRCDCDFSGLLVLCRCNNNQIMLFDCITLA